MNLMPIETVKKLRDAWERGLSTRAAARSVAVNRNTCAKYFRMWASDGATVDPLRREDRGSIADAETMCMECIISPDLKSQLIQAAVARKTSLNHFVGFLLEIIVEENLIPAILDENGDADIPEPMPTKRNCLCCGAGFFSAHRFNRLCRECAAAGAEGPGDPAVDYVSNAAAIVEGRMGGFVRR